MEEASLELGGNRAGEGVHDEVDVSEEAVEGVVKGVNFSAEFC